MKEGWVLVQRETDEFYGIVQYRDNHGNLTDETQIVETGFSGKYVFCNAGLRELKIVK